MELKILNSILFTHLRPWLLEDDTKKILSSNVKALSVKEPKTHTDYETELVLLLANNPELAKWLKGNNKVVFNTKFSKPNEIELQLYTDAISKYYYYLITLEAARLYNKHCTFIETLTKKVDIIYNTNIALKNTKALLLNTVQKIKELELSFQANEQSNLTEFTLSILRSTLTELYLNVQSKGKEYLKNTTSVEDLYLIDLELPKSLITEVKTSEVEIESNPINQEWICFGFKDDVNKLRTVINQLSSQITLINDDVCSVDDVINALTAKKLLPNAYTIKLGCETKMFRYIIDKLSIYFNDLSLANIERSGIFYSNQDKKNKPITSGNLSSSKNKSLVEPKEKATIDKIFKHLQ